MTAGKVSNRSLCIVLVLLTAAAAPVVDAAWTRHTIGDSGRGADGVRLLDVDGDGREDIVTGWEESGHVCIYFAPPPDAVRQPWPHVVVGQLRAVEDAVAIRDSQHEPAIILSCHEGNEKRILVHRFAAALSGAPPVALLESGNWRSADIASAQGMTRWMFATPIHDASRLVGIIVGSKDPAGQVSLLAPPMDAGTASVPVERWQLTKLETAGWIMSLVPVDMDGDGDEDVAVSDRKGPRRGVYWLEQPSAAGAGGAASWRRHDIGGADAEVMFLDAQRDSVITATRNGIILRFLRTGPETWQTIEIGNPFGLRNGKAVRRFPADSAAANRLVVDFNTAVHPGDRGKPGVVLIDLPGDEPPVDISGLDGKKFDRLELRDLDGDGDLDVLTCEERDNLGVFWYENPGV